MKIRPVGAEWFHSDGRRQADMTMLIIAFSNFATFWNVIEVPQLWALQIHDGTFHIVMHQIPTL